MAPNNSGGRGDPLDIEDVDLVPDEATMKLAEEEPSDDFKPEIVWFNVYWYAMLHLCAIYGLYLGLFQANWATISVGEFTNYMFPVLDRSFPYM
jgi:hypothetical protein